MRRLVKRIHLQSQEERYHFELPAKPDVVEFDPEEWLLKTLKFEKPLSMLLVQLKESIDASSRKRAAEGLSSFKNDAAVVEALEGVARNEGDHYSVRSEAALSLGKIGSKQALEALLRLSSVSQRRVRRAVVAALGEFKDRSVSQPLLSALRGDASPYVQCQAALSYAKAGMPEAYAVLTAAVGTPSPGEAISEACLDALGYVKEPRTREFLRDHLPYGQPVRVRVGALKGFARLGWLEEADVSLLKNLLLEDKEYYVRIQILDAVSDLLDRRLLDAVREAAEKDVDPRVRRRAMDVALRLSDASSVERALSEVKEDVERVSAESREFRERFSGKGLA